MAHWALWLLLLLFVAGCTPPGARALLTGKRLIEQGKYDQAVGELRKATALLATNAQAWNYLGLACHHAGQPTEAERAYQRALALNRDLAEAHFNLGCLWLERNKPEAAKLEFTAYTLRRGNSVDGFLKLGTAQLRTRDWAGAEKSFNDVLRLNPQSPEALNGVGLARLQRGRPAEAAQWFNHALKQQPNYRPALLNLAIVSQSALKDRQVALQKYREYAALKPAPPNIEAVRAVVRQLEQELHPTSRPVTTNAPAPTLINAITNPAKLVATNPLVAANPSKPTAPTNPPVPKPATPSNSVPPMVTPARAASSNFEVVNVPAGPVFKPAQDLSPPTPVQQQPPPSNPATTTIAPPASTPLAAPKTTRRGFFQRLNPLNLFHSGDKPPPRATPLPARPVLASNHPQPAAPPSNPAPTNAAKAAEVSSPRYTYLAPPKPEAGNRAEAEVSFRQGLNAQKEHRLAEAVQAYRQAVQLDPSFFEGQYNLGLATADTGDLPGALTAYEQALALRPESLDARYNFALVLKMANYLTDAVNEFEKLLAAYPNETRAHLALGNLYAQLHQPSRARPHYLKVLELEPRHPQANAIRYWLTSNH